MEMEAIFIFKFILKLIKRFLNCSIPKKEKKIMAQDSDFNDQVPSTEIAQDKGVRASTATKWKNRDLQLMSLTENPSFIVAKTTGQTIGIGSADIVVNWDSPAIYDKGRAGEKFDFANSRFNPKISGQYFLHVQLYFGGFSASPLIQIRKNGGLLSEYSTPGNNTVTLCVGVFLDGVSDYVDVTIQQGASAPVMSGPNMGSRNFFQGYRIVGLGF